MIVDGADARLEFDRAGGTYSIYTGDTALIEGARVHVLKRVKKEIERLDSDGPWQKAASTDPWTGSGGFTVCKPEAWGRVLFSAGVAKDGTLVVRVGLIWETGEDGPSLEALIPMLVPPGGIWPGRASSKNWRVYVHGWQCWTPSGVVKGSRPGDYLLPLFLPRRLKPMVANPTTPVSSERGRFHSEWFAAMADTAARDSLLAGFIGVSEMLSYVMVNVGRRPASSELEARAVLDGIVPPRGQSVWSEALAIIPGDLSCANFDAYARLLAGEQGVAEVRRTPAGWCSWYQYYTRIDQAEVISNLEVLSGERDAFGVELVQVDDGYAPAVGDWLDVREGFSDGMAALAERISSRGKIPGIWVAPFTVTRRSRVFREKKEWLQRNRKGKLVLGGVSPDWGGRFYGLDVTNPGVLEWLGEVFGSLAGCGYRFFKLDFMACGLLEGERHDPGVTRARAARRALEVIRDAVGEDSYIMAAGGPVLLGVGILDAQRVSGDVAPFWRASHQSLLRDRATPGVRNSLMNTMARAFMSGRLFDSDPDCLMTRVSDTKLTDDERRTLASAVAAFGGSIMISDDLSRWGDAEVELAATSLPHAHGLPSVPDLWDNEIPELMVSRMRDPAGEYILVFAINWFNSERNKRIALPRIGLTGRWHACEFWSGEYLGEVSTELALAGIKPHGCALVRLTRAEDGPRLVGSNVNLSQGSAELLEMESSPEGVSLLLRSPVKCEAVLTLSLPGAGEVVARAPGHAAEVERLTTSVYRVRFDIEGEGRLQVLCGA